MNTEHEMLQVPQPVTVLNKTILMGLKEFRCSVDGKIHKHHVTNDLQLREFEFKTTNPITLFIDEGNNPCLHFLYSIKGTTALSMEGRTKTVSSFQSAILFDKKGSGIRVHFEGEMNYKICWIRLKRTTEEYGLFSQLEDRFQKLGQPDYFLFVGPPDLTICEKVTSLLKQPKLTLSNNLITWGSINIILGMKLNEYIDSKQQNNLKGFGLSSREMEQVREISEFIHNNPESQYSIDHLCRKTGLSGTKLQQGFKKMHGRTVAKFILDTRLEKAEKLMKATDLNVSEIVYTIGLTSRSYFSRIFKRKYKCTPKSYIKKINSLVASA